MNKQCDTILIELISSRICHDLISPIGAIANGLEIMEEMGADDDVVSLISFSTGQANAKLKALRIAYGLGGADESIKNEQIHLTFDNLVSGDNRITQDWDPHKNFSFEARRGFPKLFMCCLMMICDTLPKGGTVYVKQDEEQSNTILISAQGENSNINRKLTEALANETPVENLDPKQAHYYITGLFAKKYGYNISINVAPDNFIHLRLKQADVSC